MKVIVTYLPTNKVIHEYEAKAYAREDNVIEVFNPLMGGMSIVFDKKIIQEGLLKYELVGGEIEGEDFYDAEAYAERNALTPWWEID